ncbi:MAG: NAD-dependent epimerase/dehydratase family protein [Candidatus Korarchaeum sp.]|nr:NAD-dependent epimerase/dehydratase family protein [Candidatus Korarchaeum sp.]MDW8035642.1 NAD-dependent epimerase/dehydratase family protein [Candidatus Korarchaeum sp.]
MIVVTGGAGFIGSNLVVELLRRGHEVTFIDNFSTGSREVARKLEVMGANLLEGSSSRVTELGSVDAILHLGIPSSSPMYREDPSLVGSALSEFVSLIEYARRRGVKLIYASTSSIYNGNEPPHREDMPVRPTDLYTEARYFMERIANVYQSLYGVKSIGLRLFSVYGPNEKPKGKYANVLSQMIWAGLEGRSFVIFGDGSQTRDFIHVRDVVKAFIKAIESDVHGIFNVGTGKETSFKELFSLIEERLPLSLEFKSNPIRNYVLRTCADTSLAEEMLGFKAEIDLKRGIEELIEAYRRTDIVFGV